MDRTTQNSNINPGKEVNRRTRHHIPIAVQGKLNMNHNREEQFNKHREEEKQHGLQYINMFRLQLLFRTITPLAAYKYLPQSAQQSLYNIGCPYAQKHLESQPKKRKDANI